MPLTARATTFYVAPNGSTTGMGTQADPFLTWNQGQTAAKPGDTVYFRGGAYKYTDSTSTCGGDTTATVNAVVLSKSGTAANPINYWAFPGEIPVFDFSGITDPTKYNCRHAGVRVEGDWLYLKGLEVKGTLQLNNLNHESWGVYIFGGSNNKFELINSHHNMGPGFFIEEGGNNTFLNCDSHENEDTLTSNGDGQSADGFGCHPTRVGDTGNVFHGCRSWWNSDDSWDFINAAEACTVEYSWAWYSGYKPDALSGGAPVPLQAGNGNGFKGGGYNDPQKNVPAVPPQHVIRENCAFFNKANGLYANHEIVSPFFYNNTSFNNGVDVDMLGLNGTTVTSVGTLRNNLAYSNNGHTLLGDLTNGGPISDAFNSWDTNLNLKVTDADFQSVAFAPPASCPVAYVAGGTACCSPTDMTCFAGMASARQANGSLPVLPFLRLAAGSALIGKGTNVGLPFSEKAPDLGCFDTGLPFDPSDGGVSGTSGTTGTTGATGTSGAMGTSGTTGTTGATGTSGTTGTSGATGTSGTGTTGVGTTGTSGPMGATGAAGASIASGSSAGYSDASMPSGASSGNFASGSAATAGNGSAASGSASDDGSRGCSVLPGARGGGGRVVWLLLGVVAVLSRRRARGGVVSRRVVAP